MAEDTFYFSHDYNSRSDKNVKRLLAKHGILGYGVFWAIVEDLYNNANALPLHYDSIAYDLRADADMVKSIIHDFDLFVSDGTNFGSTSVEARLAKRNQKSKKASESAYKRWGKPTNDANALQSQCEPNAIKERKGKETKGKERKVNEIINSGEKIEKNAEMGSEEKKEKEKPPKKEKEIPSEDDFLDYCREILQTRFPEYEFSLRSKYKTWIDQGWRDGYNTPISNWKNKIANTIPHFKPIRNGTTNNKPNSNKVAADAYEILQASKQQPASG